MRIPSWDPASAGIGLKPAAPTVEPQKQDGPEQARLKQACQDFEAIFLNFLLSKMRETVPKDGLMGGGRGEEIYRGMLDDELARQMAAAGGVGLAETLFRQIEDAPPPAPPAGGEADENRRHADTTDTGGIPREGGAFRSGIFRRTE